MKQVILTSGSWGIDVNEVKARLTAGTGRPEWILSTFGPVVNSPASLLDGNEFSPEELRVRFYELKASGNEVQAINEAGELWAKAEQRFAEIIQNLNRIVPYLEEAEKTHPNRHDFLKMTGTTSVEQVVKEALSKQVFGQTSGPAFGTSAFGFGSQTGGTPAPDPFASKASGGSNETFGQPSQPSGFGAPSFGQPSVPAFGQSGFGQLSNTSSFIKPSSNGFGQPSTSTQALPSSNFGVPAFGQPTANTAFPSSTPSTFGQPINPASTVGSSSQPISGFGQPSFGQPPQPTSGFGQPSQVTSTFGQPANSAPGFGQPSQPSSGFGQPSQGNSSFGQPSQLGTTSDQGSTFGQPGPSQAGNPFGGGGQTNDVFGNPSLLAPSSTSDRPNPFGSNSSKAPALGGATAPMGQASSMLAPDPTFIPTTSTSTPHPLTSKPPTPIHYTQTLPAGQTSMNPTTKRLTTFRSRPVKYINDEYPCYQRPDGKGWERIWLPDGADNVRLDEVQLKDEAVYETEEVKEPYRLLAGTGGFEVGKIPTVPPKREWIGFDF